MAITEEKQGASSAMGTNAPKVPLPIVPQPNSRLLCLAQELRDLIYEHIFPDTEYVTLVQPPRTSGVTDGLHVYPYSPETETQVCTSNDRIYLAILYTCRQIRGETQKLFWDQYTFPFQPKTMFECEFDAETSTLWANLKHVEIELSLSQPWDNREFIVEIFDLILKAGKNLQSVSIRNGVYEDKLREENRIRLESSSRWFRDRAESCSDYRCIGYFGRYVANGGPLSNVKRKMIFSLSKTAHTSNYTAFGSSDTDKQLNRWLSKLHRHWGGELWFNDRLLRSDDQHLARVEISVTGPATTELSFFIAIRKAPVSATFKSVENAADEAEWLGMFQASSDRCGNIVAVNRACDLPE